MSLFSLVAVEMTSVKYHNSCIIKVTSRILPILNHIMHTMKMVNKLQLQVQPMMHLVRAALVEGEDPFPQLNPLSQGVGQ